MEIKRNYLIEQVSRLREQALGALLATLVVLAYVYYFIHTHVNQTALLIWVGLILAINGYLVLWMLWIHQKGVSRENVSLVVYSYQLEAILHGLAWGYLPFMLMQSPDIDTQLFSYYVICGMAAGAIATTGMIYRIYISYMLPMMLPVIFYQVFQSEFQFFTGSTISLLIIFVIAMLLLSYRHYESVLKSIILSMKNQELVEDLQQEYERAEEASLAKTRFLANMSHELRTPLNAVIGYSEIIEDEAADSGSENIAHDAEKIRMSGKHLLKMIDDVLNLSRLDAGRITVEQRDFSVGELVARIRPALEDFTRVNDNKLSMEIEAGIDQLHSDPTIIETLILNLISNAGKFTRDGEVKLHIYKLQDTGELCIEVSDTGIGMTEAQQAIMFDAFRQADESSTRKYGGMGLGMAICYKFVQLMGGHLHVESSPGKGTRVSICLHDVIPEQA